MVELIRRRCFVVAQGVGCAGLGYLGGRPVRDRCGQRFRPAARSGAQQEVKRLDIPTALKGQASPFPLKKASAARVATLSLTLAGRNLWRSTPYKGVDPESNYFSGSRGSVSDFQTQAPPSYWTFRLKETCRIDKRVNLIVGRCATATLLVTRI